MVARQTVKFEIILVEVFYADKTNLKNVHAFKNSSQKISKKIF